MALWVAASGIFLIGAGVVWEGIKGLTAGPDKKGRQPPRGTSYTFIAVGVVIMIVGAVIPFVA